MTKEERYVVNPLIRWPQRQRAHETERQVGDWVVPSLDIGRVIVSAKDDGTVDEEYWHYDYVQTCWSNPPDVTRRRRFSFNDVWMVFVEDHAKIVARIQSDEADAALKHLSNDNVASIRSVLAQFRIPVAVAVPVFFKAETHLDAGWEDGPDIHMPSPASRAAWREMSNRNYSSRDGWHTIAVCGYSDSAGRFELKNSWGAWWGRNGFGTIPYNYIRVYSREAFNGTA